MGYFFQCDHCDGIIPVAMGDDLNHARYCLDCGGDGCVDCMPDEITPLCDECAERREGDDVADAI